MKTYLQSTLALALAMSVCAHAGETKPPYPDKPIRLIVTYPPGGGSDLIARAVGQKLTEAWKQQVVIDNRAGAGGIIGTEIAARAQPDGYTLLLGASSGLVLNPLLNGKLSYDTFRDFAPVSLLVIGPQLLVTHPSVPANSVKELVALAKSNPGKLNYASVGQGSPNHLGMELLKSMTATDMVHVPYKGSAAITELLGGQVQVMFNSIPPLLPHVKTGKLKAIGVGSTQRSKAVPAVPTVAEAGVPGFENVTWFAMLAPARTSRDVVTKLNKEIGRILTQAEMADRFLALGVDPRVSTPEELTKFMRLEAERWGRVVKATGIKVE